jgi:hypothetical protein
MAEKTPTERAEALTEFVFGIAPLDPADVRWALSALAARGGQETAAEWPLRGRVDLVDGELTAEECMAELLRPHSADTRWAYDTIRELSGMVRALTAGDSVPVRRSLMADVPVCPRCGAVGYCTYHQWNLPDVETTTTLTTTIETTIGSGELSPESLATLVRVADMFAASAAREGLPVEAITLALSEAEALLDTIRDNDPSLCDPNCPGRAGGPHHHVDPS